METIYHYLRKLAVGAAVCLLTISTSMSDDIDLYVSPPDVASPGATFVIFTLDLRPNVLASTVCNNEDEEGNNVCLALFSDPLVGMEDELSNGSTTYLKLLVAALKKVLRSIDNPKVEVALMVPHDDTGGGNKENKCLGFQGKNVVPQCSNGAYVLSAFRPVADQTELNKFFEKLEAIPFKDGSNWGHRYQLKELLFEMYRYMVAGHVFNSENGLDNFGTRGDTDPDGNPLNINHTRDTESVYPPHNEDLESGTNLIAELMWDTDAVEPSEKVYRDSLDTAEHCSSIFSVNLTDGTASADDDSDSYIEQDLGISLDSSNHQSRLQVLQYLENTDISDSLEGLQNIRSYFVAKSSGGSGDAGGRANDWAQAGGTGSALIATDDPDELVELLSGLFNEIEGVSTSFVAASVPANVFNRAETLNEVFLAIFDPNPNELEGGAGGGGPFWVGNVKKLTTRTIEEATSCIDTNDDGIEDECVIEERKILVDVLEAEKDPPESAINPLDGRIRPGALTYWTRTGDHLTAPSTDKEKKEFTEGTDGRKVDRGGSGQAKPGFLDDGPGEVNSSLAQTEETGDRKLFTEDEAHGATLVALNADNNQNTFTTAKELLNDGRYGNEIFQTVMEDDCVGCDDYSSADQADQEMAQLRVNNLIRYARGFDVNLDTPTNEAPGKRSWWQADPLHSRPLALNYGARTNDYTQDRPDIRVVVSGNDGLVQMIRDGRKSDDSEDGVEAWAFLPREFVPLQKRLLQGTNGLYQGGVPINDDEDPRTPLHPYAMDGAPTALVIDNNLDGTIDTSADDQVYMFIGQRRGGKRYYALDVSDPDNPEFLWSIGKDDDSGNFAEMAQSWSLIRTGIMAVDEGGEVPKRRPVAIFTGGFNGDDGGDGVDLGKDLRVAPGDDGIYGYNAVTETNDDVPIVGTDDDEGNALFIVNALTGELIWKVVGPTPDSPITADDPATPLILEHPDLVDSVAASPTILDANGNGHVDRIYFADTGGNVWRMDAATPDREDWTVSRLFEGGRHFQNDLANDRRFFHSPDIVLAKDEDGPFDAVILTSGDRPHPLGTDVTNWIYMIKDRGNNSTPISHNDLADLTDNCIQDEATECALSVSDNLVNGWKVKLEQCYSGDTGTGCGEKGLASPLTIGGTIFFTTYLPVLDTDEIEGESTICGVQEGGGLLYGLDLKTAGGALQVGVTDGTSQGNPPRIDRLTSPGIPPNVVAISPEEILRPDLAVQKTEGVKSGETFWYDRRFR